MKPRIRPVMRVGQGHIWECKVPVAPLVLPPYGMTLLHFAHGVHAKGHGYTPKEAFEDWKAQQ